MLGYSNSQELFDLIFKKCQDLKILTYESENHADESNGAKLIGSLIAYYESDVQMKSKTI
jgi:hypothetical protein